MSDVGGKVMQLSEELNDAMILYEEIFSPEKSQWYNSLILCACLITAFSRQEY